MVSFKMTAIILAGGQNKRIGVNKAFLDINGTTIIEIIVGKLQPLFKEILVVTKSPFVYQHLGARVVTDLRSDSGSLIGLYTGLLQSMSLHSFVTACDMPLLNPPLIKYMRSHTRGYDVVVPKLRGNYEPLFAFYSKRCLPFIERLLQKGNLRIVDFYQWVKIRSISQREVAKFDPEGLSFLDMNTIEDYQRLIKKEGSNLHYQFEANHK